MATKELVSNLKLITSGNVPTTSNLGNGELAFGLVGGVAKLYGNVNGTIVDFSNFVEALACDIHKDFSAGGNGKVCIGSIPVYDNNITIDISCTTADTYHGTLVIATQNYYIKSAVMYGDENNMLAPLVKIEHTEGIVTVYCAFPGWSKNQVHIKVTPKQGEVTRVLEKVTEMPTTNLYNFTKALAFPVTSVNNKTGAVTLNKSDVGLGNVNNTADANKSVAQAAAWKGTDTRNVNSPPSFYQRENMKSVYEFKQTKTIEVNSLLPDTFCYVQTLTPWGDSSGGLPVQLAAQGYNGTARYAIRSAKDESTWGAWKKIATQDEIPSGGSPYVTTILSWSGSSGNYYSTISATTHSKGAYPSVHTYVQNGNLWEETYDSPAIDSSGNVTVYTNSAILTKVVIK